MKLLKTGISVSIFFLALQLIGIGTCLAANNNPDMPQGLWQAFSKAVHKIEPAKGKDKTGYFAQNPKNHLVFNFSKDGFAVKSGVAGHDWSLSMQLAAYGQEGNLSPVPAAELATEGKRIEYQRGRVVEWYVNNPSGLEQGFTLEKPQGYDPDKPVELSLNLEGGLIPTVSNARDVTFSKADGGHAFDYKGLKAFDAKNNSLPARLVLAGNTLQIMVDTGQASWPVTVDPIISSQTKLLPITTTSDDRFAASVSVYGSLALIGAPYHDDLGIDSGAAFVFHQTNGEWSPQAKLTDELDGEAGDHFGDSVSLQDDIILVGAPHDDDYRGSAVVFILSGNSWSDYFKLFSSDGAADDYFGKSVSLHNNTILVGAPYDDDLGSNSGSAYVFKLTDDPDLPWIWEQQAKLTASDSTAGDHFGYSVSLNNDTALVGAYLDDVYSGSAYIFVRPPTGWTDTSSFDAKLTSTDSEEGDWFGESVSLYNDSALIGASWGDGAVANSGAAYVFVKPATGWATTSTFDAKLTASDGAYDDLFGTSVSLSVDTALIGAYLVNDNGQDTGSAYVFVRSGPTWSQQAKLSPSDRATGDQFGRNVSLYNDTAVIGAALDDDNGNATGSAYVFERSGTTWTEKEKVHGYDGEEDDYFGTAVSLAGDTVLIGALRGDDDNGINTGSVYIFTRTGTTWSPQAKLLPSDGSASDFFGTAVSLSENTALVGAYGDDDNGYNSGSAYVFIRSGTTWSQQSKLLPSDGTTVTSFGKAVSISGDTALIGAWNAAYVFVRSGTTWSEQAKLLPSDLEASDAFGNAVSLTGNTALVGAYQDDDNGITSGSAYVFTRSGTTWSEQAKLLASDGEADDRFGDAVSLTGNTALVGAPEDDDNGTHSGSAYVFTRSGTTWREQIKLLASDGAINDSFGDSVYISGDTALVGARNYGAYPDDNDIGAAYVFIRAGSAWIEQDKLLGHLDNERFGNSVSIADDTTLVGASESDILGWNSGSAYVNQFNCGFGDGVVPGRWTMIGIPCDLGTTNTVEDVFGDNFLPSEYLWAWVLYKRDEATDRYVRLDLDSPLILGEGYWLMSSNWGVWDAYGDLTSYVQSGLCASPKGCFEITLSSPDTADTFKWNLVGNPGNKTANWSAVSILVDGSLYTPSDAEAAGYVSKTIYKYNGNAYEAYDDGTPGMEGSLESHEGFWIRVLSNSYGHTIKLMIPNGETFGGPPEPPTVFNQVPVPQKQQTSWWQKIIDFIIPSAQAAPPERLDEWYVRLIVETPTENLRDRNNVLGQLIDSVDGYDSHDLPELPPFAAPYLTIVFPHNDWGDHSDDYSSDYHAAGSREADQWVFQVKSDDPYRSMTLLWENIKMLQSQVLHATNKREWTTHKEKSGEPIMAKMWLEDIDTGVMIKAVEDGIAQSYTFDMDGKTIRTFRWIKKGPGGKLPREPKNISKRTKKVPDIKKLLPPQAQGEPPGPGQKR